MKTQSLILLVGAIALAAGTALVARALMRPPPPVTIVKEVEVPATPAPPIRLVLVSARALQPGEFIDGAALAWRELPAQALRASHVSADSEAARLTQEQALYGATLRRPVDADEPLTREVLIRSGEPGFLPAVLQPGMRAISIPTGTVPSNAGLVAAGDWVDVILSLDRADAATSSRAAALTGGFAVLAAQTVVRQVRVLALNRETASLAPVTAGALAEQEGEAGSRRRAPAGYESLTLEVSPADAERLVVAREVGTLQVALRDTRSESPASEAAGSLGAVTRLNDATTVLRYGQPSRVNAYRGNSVTPLEFGGAP